MNNVPRSIAYLVLFLSFWMPTSTFAQVSFNSIPYSSRLDFQYQYPNHKLESSALPSLDLTKIKKEDEQAEQSRFAAAIDVRMNLENNGQWLELANGDRLWQLKISSSNAKGLYILYEDFYLPQGGELWMYNEDKTQVLGSYTQANNKESGKFMTGSITAETEVLEYFEPKEVRGQGIIDIFKIFHVYEPIRNQSNYEFQTYAGYGDGLDCHVNMNCPEGNDWQDHKHGVMRILRIFDQGMGWCSGTLINNTENDAKPYILSAYHCIDMLDPLYDFWRFDFNYESENCNDPISEPSFQSVLGCDFRSGWQDSDFLLLELTEAVPTSFHVYFNGWNRHSTQLPSSAAGIHHPQGDIKKVSIENDPATIQGTQIIWSNGVTTPSSHHLRVLYDSGTIENGSSGSPLFDNNGLIVGQLHGGNASCTSFITYYGRFSLSWEGGGTAASRLKDWLDPNDSGVITVGAYAPPVPSLVSLSGTVNTVNGEPIPDVIVEIDGDMNYTTVTDANGVYTFENIPDGGNYSIVPTKDTRANNGVNGFDLIKISKDILLIDPITDPFQMIAADVNRSNTISIFDLIEMRKIILYILTEFSNSDSWRFVNESYELNMLNGPASDLDFVGVKIGDVNGSADPEL